MRQPSWSRWSDEQLLDVRMCDLGVSLKGSVLERRILDLGQNLNNKGIPFRAHFWLSDDWFTPDGIPGIAVPFYLAHPRLQRLERSQILEVEGSSRAYCMRILRHEMGHAIDNAYRLRRKRKRQTMFGLPSTPYPEYYTPKPYSKSFVSNLESWYAQSHPDEDFAETFAVWLDPRSAWERRYSNWPALKKLRYMDELMATIRWEIPAVTTKHSFEPLPSLKKTLREHYSAKRRRYGIGQPVLYDRELQQLFSSASEHSSNPLASEFLTRASQDIRQLVSKWTGQYQYQVGQVLSDMIKRSDILKLHLRTSTERTKLDFVVLLTVQITKHLSGGRHRIAL